jgi:hypothetical protein
MPEALRWHHIIINTHSSWLHGDPRGFRSRDHRIHSSGDYKNPPPPGEHDRLHRYQHEKSAPPTILQRPVFRAIGLAALENLLSQKYKVEAVAVTPTHLHVLALVPDDWNRLREVVSWVKRFATRAARMECPESLTRIRDEAHLGFAKRYILEKQGSDAWTWCPELSAKW